MFRSKDVRMILKTAKLISGTDDKGVEHSLCEAQLVIEPLLIELARELGEDVSVHLFTDGGAVRTGLETVTLDPRVPKQCMSVRGAIGLVPTEIRHVGIDKLIASRQVSKDTGAEWIKATVKVVFDLAPKINREWVVMHFSKALHFSFDAEQGDMLDSTSPAAKFVEETRKLMDKREGSITSMEMTVSDGKGRRKGTRITKDTIEDVDRPEA